MGEIVVEIKAVKTTRAEEHRAQVIDYRKSTDRQLELMVSFGHDPKSSTSIPSKSRFRVFRVFRGFRGYKILGPTRSGLTSALARVCLGKLQHGA